MIFLAVKRPLGTIREIRGHPSRSIKRLEILARIEENNISKMNNMYTVSFNINDIIQITSDTVVQQCIQETNKIGILEEYYSRNIVEFDSEDDAKLYFELMD